MKTSTEENLARIRSTCARCVEMAEDPEYIRNAQKLEKEWTSITNASREIAARIRRQANGIPEEHVEHFANYEPCPTFFAMLGFLSSSPDKRFLVLSGLRGVGKSFALAWAADKSDGMFTTAQNLVESSSWDSYWEELKRTPFLAIDELGAEHGNPAYDANLYELLNTRYMNLRKTAIATNLTPEAFRSRYLALGLDRLLDRLRTGGEWVNCVGESKRRHWSETEKP